MIKILIVDDQNSVLYLLQSIFSKILNVSLIGLATNGQEALEMVAQYHPDMVVMDIKMPVMDGIEATKILHQQFQQIKVILYTSYDDRQIRDLAIKAGASAFLNKAHLDCLEEVVSLVGQGYEYFQFEQVS